VDDSSGGGGNNIEDSVDREDDISDVSGGTLERLMNMAKPCVRQTSGVNWSEDDGRGDKRGSGRGEEG
jgi:hypothetical protein